MIVKLIKSLNSILGLTYSTNVTFRIIVTDVDDNGPKFDLKVFTVSVPENLNVGSHIVRALARDPDSTSKLYYTMISKISGKHVSIDNKTGKFIFYTIIFSGTSEQKNRKLELLHSLPQRKS